MAAASADARCGGGGGFGGGGAMREDTFELEDLGVNGSLVRAQSAPSNLILAFEVLLDALSYVLNAVSCCAVVAGHVAMVCGPPQLAARAQPRPL
jgi:hypothetical protein